MTLLAAFAAALAVGAAAAADLDETQFRYTRTLAAQPGAPVRFEPDGRLYAHARVDFPDVRILDARGEQVPWRPEPLPDAVPSQTVELVARGRRGDVVSVVVDRGPVRDVIDRVALEIPDRVFVGEVVVQGSTRARRVRTRRCRRLRSTVSAAPSTPARRRPCSRPRITGISSSKRAASRG